MKTVLAIILLLLIPSEFGHSPQVILLIVDGADPSNFSLENFSLEGQCTAVFPTMTSPGHVSLLTGVYPSRHGILANEYVKDEKTLSYSPENIESETLFDIVKENGKKGIFISGKDELAAFIGVKANLSVSPGLYPVYVEKPPEDPLELTQWIFDAIIAVNEREHPDFMCVSINILDDFGHTYGPTSKETKNAAKTVQSLIYALRESLNANTTLIVTSDHGMSPVSKAIPIHVLLGNAGYSTWPQYVGRCAFLYDTEEGVKEFVSKIDGVKTIIEPQDYVKYHVDHRNSPDLIVLAREDYLFIPEPLLKYYRGMHGSVEEMDIPLYMDGAGIPQGYTECSQVDIAPLIVSLLNLETDAAFDGSIPQIEKEASGYGILVLCGLLFFAALRKLLCS